VLRECGPPLRANRDTSKPDLYIPIGLPASGKSTWATTVKHHVICPDTYRQQVYGTERPLNGLISKYEGEVWRWAYAQLNEQQRERQHLIFDATNLSPSRRTRLRNLAPRHNHVAVFFDTPLELCLARNATRRYPVPQQVIEQMHERMQPPSHAEKFDDIWLVTPGGK